MQAILCTAAHLIGITTEFFVHDATRINGYVSIVHPGHFMLNFLLAKLSDSRCA